VNRAAPPGPSQHRPPAGEGAAPTPGAGQPATARQPRRGVVRRAGALAVTAGATIAADQATKTWAEDHLWAGPEHVAGPANLVLTYNSGAAFSLGSGATPVIEALAMVLVAVVVWQSGRLARSGTGWAPVVALGLLCGGALSNLGDRVFRHHGGGVIDFIQLVSWWPVFNVADAAITVGAIALAASLVAGTGPRQDRGPGPRPDGTGHDA
jgi:signal peptidase II